MSILGWLFGRREVHVHLHGTVNLNCENLQLDTSIRKTTSEIKVDHESDVELEPDLGDIKVPEVEFGEDV